MFGTLSLVISRRIPREQLSSYLFYTSATKPHSAQRSASIFSLLNSLLRHTSQFRLNDKGVNNTEDIQIFQGHICTHCKMLFFVKISQQVIETPVIKNIR